MRYWNDETVLEIPVVGTYKGPKAILEYYLLQNKNFNVFGQHFMDESVEEEEPLNFEYGPTWTKVITY